MEFPISQVDKGNNGLYNYAVTLQLLISSSCTMDKVLINGSLEASIPVTCSRCFEYFQHKFKASFIRAFVAVHNALADLASQIGGGVERWLANLIQS